MALRGREVRRKGRISPAAISGVCAAHRGSSLGHFGLCWNPSARPFFTRLHVYGISNVDLQLHITASIRNTPEADLSFRYEARRATGGVSEERRDRAVFF